MKMVVALIVLSSSVALTGAPKLSADGLPFPEVPANIAEADRKMPMAGMPGTLKRAEDLMMRAPSAVPTKFYSSEKSAKMLAAKMTRAVTIDHVVHDTNSNEVTRLHKNVVVQFHPPCGWFGAGFAGASVLGIDCPNGFIERIVLYFPDAQNAQRALLTSYGSATGLRRAVNVGGWIPLSVTGECLLSPSAIAGNNPIWIPAAGSYPVMMVFGDSTDEIRQAMAKKELALGMSLWEAEAVQGESIKIHSEVGEIELRKFGATETFAEFEKGKIVSMGR